MRSNYYLKDYLYNEILLFCYIRYIYRIDYKNYTYI